MLDKPGTFARSLGLKHFIYNFIDQQRFKVLEMEKAFEREAEFPLVLKNCKALLDSQPHNQNLRQRLYSFVDHQVLQSFS